jgi:pimeloyl-ACP methyl ester carboxylesterase
MDMERLQLEDGRFLEFCQSEGQGSAELLVFHVGTPCAGALYPNVTSVATARRVRTVSYSRAGYGGSTRSRGRSVAEEASNTAALADHLGVSSFLVAGLSGGGPAALACAALLPERVSSCAVLASASPPGEVGEVWFEWYPEDDREELRTLATSSPDALARAYEDAAVTFASITPQAIANWPGSPDAERKMFDQSPGFAEALADSMRRGVEWGVDGWMDDAVALARPWGFSVGDVQVPVTIRHGARDPLVRVDHAKWLTEHVPGARAEIMPDQGHASVIDPFDEVMDDLMKAR